MVGPTADVIYEAAGEPAGQERDLIAIVEGLVRDLHAAPAGSVHITPASRLDRDLGIDSIGRVELMLRIERDFRLRLPTTVLSEVETVADLLAAVERTAMRSGPMHAGATPTARPLPSVSAPEQARTLVGSAGVARRPASQSRPPEPAKR